MSPVRPLNKFCHIDIMRNILLKVVVDNAVKFGGLTG